jgi:uncharacterized protein (TIGR00290 family)
LSELGANKNFSMIKSIFNWSGGKDSALALYHILKERDYNIESLVTTINQDKKRISMHGVREALLDKQVESLGLPMHKIMLNETPSMEEYDSKIKAMLSGFKDHGITHSIFGDIFLEDLKAYRDEKLEQIGMTGYYPLWQIDSYKLFNEFITLGFRAVIVCTNADYLDDSYLGRELDHDFLNVIPSNVDPCGENGEYHSFVFDGPIFDHPVDFTLGEKVLRTFESGEESKHDTNFWYLDLLEN